MNAAGRSGPRPVVIGLDIGTYSSKGVACDPDGAVVAEARLAHGIDTPAPGRVEQDADAVWWHDVTGLSRALVASVGADHAIAAVCVTTTGPCLVPVDRAGAALRPGILYGVDVRATEEIAELEARIGRRAIRRLGGLDLSSQSVGPKIAWIARHEPDVWRRTARVHTATSYVVERLTGIAVIDRHQACYFTPFYATRGGTWDLRGASDLDLAGRLPAIGWPTDIAGSVTPTAAAATGLPVGTPVLVGTSDAMTEAAGVGAMRPGLAALSYGSTAGVTTFGQLSGSGRGLWASEGIVAGLPSIGGALSTSGSIMSWFRRELARELPQATADDISTAHAVIVDEAASSSLGANGLLFLPYLSGERTPFADPLARGTLAGLSLAHTRGDVARAILEGTAFGIRQLLEALAEQGAGITTIRVTGGGTASRLGMQIVSDVTGLTQEIPAVTVGASYGAAYLAALATGLASADPDNGWVRIVDRVEPDPVSTDRYAPTYALYRRLYRDTRTVNHALARMQVAPGPAS